MDAASCRLNPRRSDPRRVKRISGSDSEIVLIPYDEAYPEDFEDMRRRAPEVSLLRSLAGKVPEAGIDTIIREILSK